MKRQVKRRGEASHGRKNGRKAVAESTEEGRVEVNEDDREGIIREQLYKAKEDKEQLVLLMSTKMENKESIMKFALKNLSDDDLESLWARWHEWLVEEVKELSSDQGSITADEDTSSAVKVLPSLLVMCRYCLAIDRWNKENSPPNNLRRSLCLLHDILPKPLTGDLREVKSEVALLCETWIEQELSQKDSLCANTLAFALEKVTSASVTRSDAKRVWKLHQYLLSHSYEDLQELGDLSHLLVAAVQSSAFIKHLEGTRFAVFLFSTPGYTKILHSAVKKVIPGLSLTNASLYGDIYLKAWRQSNAEVREVLEGDCIQDFMYHAVLANRSLPKKNDLFTPLRCILEKFHVSKSDRQLQSTLWRLWEPILWRNLKVANPMVRRNATELFFNAFPVEDAEATTDVRGEQTDKQYQLMLGILVDEFPEVRIAAVIGVCRTFAVFWQIVPLDIFNGAMTIILRDLAFDAASPKVRLAVIKGLRLILSCERSHVFLKKALTRISDCLHDVNESVRVAMVDLLIDVKNVFAIKFWEVCDVNDLLVRLHIDSSTVRKGIVKLLFNSFFPIGESEEVKIERGVYLIKNNRAASRRFYEHCERMLNLHDCVKFMLAILVNIKRYVKSEMAAASTGTDETSDHEEILTEKENRSDMKRARIQSPSVLSMSNTSQASLESSQSDDSAETSLRTSFAQSEVVAGLLDIVCIFWVLRSKEISMDENAEYRALLEKKSAKILIVLFKWYKSSEVVRPVLYLCSLLPHASVSTVAGFCLSRLRTLDLPAGWDKDNINKIDNLSILVDSLCNWGRGDDILEMITSWLRKDLTTVSGDDNPSKVRRASRRGVRFDESSSVARPDFAVVVLCYILQHALNRAMLLKKNRQQLQDLHKLLKAYLPTISVKLSENLNPEDERKFSVLWESLIKLTILLHTNEQAALLASFGEFISWSTTHFLQADKKSIFGISLTTSLLRACSNVVTIGLSDGAFIDKCLDAASLLLQKDNSLSTCRDVTMLCLESTDWAVSKKFDNESVQRICKQTVPSTLKNTFIAIDDQTTNGAAPEDYGNDFSDIKKKVQAILNTYCYKIGKLDDQPFFDLLQALSDCHVSSSIIGTRWNHLLSGTDNRSSDREEQQ